MRLFFQKPSATVVTGKVAVVGETNSVTFAVQALVNRVAVVATTYAEPVTASVTFAVQALVNRVAVGSTTYTEPVTASVSFAVQSLTKSP